MYMYMYIHMYTYMHICIYIYVCMVFTIEGFFEVAMESWPAWVSNP